MKETEKKKRTVLALLTCCIFCAGTFGNAEEKAATKTTTEKIEAKSINAKAAVDNNHPRLNRGFPVLIAMK